MHDRPIFQLQLPPVSSPTFYTYKEDDTILHPPQYSIFNPRGYVLYDNIY